jgi:hypothetical protein
MFSKPILMTAIGASALTLVNPAPANAQSVPDAGDRCISTINGQSAAGNFGRVPRSCASSTISGAGEFADAYIGNGRDFTRGFSQTGIGSTSFSKNGFQNVSNAAAGNSTTTSSADLTTGELKAGSTTAQPARPGLDPSSVPQAFSLARIGDTIFLNNTSGQNQTIQFGYRYDGAFLNGFQSPSTFADVFLDLVFGQSIRDVNALFINGGDGGGSGRSIIDASGAWTDLNSPRWTYTRFGDPASGGVFGGTALRSILIPVGLSDITFGFHLETACRTGPTTCAFGNTSALGFAGLPNGVSFTSQSGVFLTGLTGPGGVPEPATWAMMIMGFGLVGSAMRRRSGIKVTYA